MSVRFPKKISSLLVPIEQVHQHPDNPNNGDIDELVNSIQRFGFVTVITADANTGEIIAGNHRYQALLALGATEIPVLWVDHWGHDDRLGYLVGDNEIGRRARMDKSALADILTYLHTTEMGLAGTGHDENTYQALLLEISNQQLPNIEAHQYGGAAAPSGIFQVVIDFDNVEDRDEAYDNIHAEYEGYDGVVRKVNL